MNPTRINPIVVTPYRPGYIYKPGSPVILNCNGTVGKPAGNLVWCFKTSIDLNYTLWPDTGDISNGNLVAEGCQYSRISSLRFNLSADYDYVRFKCVSGSPFCNSSYGISVATTIYRG